MSEPTTNPWDLFPDYRHLATEVCGNEIVSDLSPAAKGAVFGLWHDPPMIFMLARNEREFEKVCGTPPADQTMEISQEVLDALTSRVTPAADLPGRDTASATLGKAFRAWIDSLPEGARIADLRTATPGDGFEYGDSGMIRCPGELVFALLLPERKPGFFSKLWGR